MRYLIITFVHLVKYCSSSFWLLFFFPTHFYRVLLLQLEDLLYRACNSFCHLFLPLAVQMETCLVKSSLLEVTSTVDACWKVFMCLSNFLLKVFTSWLMQDWASRSNLFGTFTTRTLVWLCFSTKFLSWPRPLWDSFLLISLMPSHTITASCFVKVLDSLFDCIHDCC